MNLRRIRPLVFLGLALIMLAAPAAHAQNPPKGDFVDDPVRVAVNARKTVKNVQHATANDGSFEEVSCDADDSSDHSVWFIFRLVNGGLVDIDSGGTVLNYEDGSASFVALTLFRVQPLGGIVEEGGACVVSSTARLTNLNLTAGEYVVRIANESVFEPSLPSQYRLSIRLRFDSGLLQNPEFADPFDEHWKIKKPGNPPKVTRVCPGGDCAIRFGGTAGGRIQQKIGVDLKWQKWVKGDLLVGDIYVNNTPVAGSDVTLTLQIAYSDGTPKTKVSATRHITQTSTVSLTYFGAVHAEIASKNVKKIVFKVSSPANSDMFTMQNPSIALKAGSSVRAPLLSVLPLPPPAQ